MRAVLLIGLTAGIMVSVSAAQDAAVAMTIETITPPEPTLGALRDLVPNAREQEAALKAQEQATLSAIEGMAAPRAVLMVSLAFSSILVFFTSMQLRWAPGRPHVRLARRLGVLGLLTAALRAIDGAQELVIAQRGVAASGRVLIELKVPDAETTVAITRWLIGAASVGRTVVVVGLFFVVSTYFRSAKVQAGFELTDEDDLDE
jgi:hypothetical protein